MTDFTCQTKKVKNTGSKNMLLVLCMFFSYAVSAQTAIDKIDSDSAAIQFFKKEIIGPNIKSNFNDFKLIDGTEWVRFYNFNEQQKEELLSKYKYRKWAKLDLNGDKKDDLIISGYLSKEVGYSEHYRIFIFLTEKNNSFSHIKFNSGVPTYFRIVDVDSQDYIEISRWRNDTYKKVKDIPLRIDTVKFQPEMQMLVDYEKRVEPSTISKVVYTEQYLPKGKIQATIVNQREKNSDFTIAEDAQTGKKPIVNKAKISRDMMSDFLDIVATLQKYERHEEASIVQPNDGFSRTLEVIYFDGSKQVFTDNTGESSYSLRAVYEWMQFSIANVYEQIEQRQNAFYYDDPFNSWW